MVFLDLCSATYPISYVTLALHGFKLPPGTSRHLVYARWNLSTWKATYCMSPSSTGLMEPPALCGGMPEPMNPKDMTSINGKGRFLTAGQTLVFSGTPGWLILSAPWDASLKLALLHDAARLSSTIQATFEHFMTVLETKIPLKYHRQNKGCSH